MSNLLQGRFAGMPAYTVGYVLSAAIFHFTGNKSNVHNVCQIREIQSSAGEYEGK